MFCINKWATITVPANLNQSIHGKMCESPKYIAGIERQSLRSNLFSAFLSNLHTNTLTAIICSLIFIISPFVCRKCGENQMKYNRKEERNTEWFTEIHTYLENVVSAALADHFHSSLTKKQTTKKIECFLCQSKCPQNVLYKLELILVPLVWQLLSGSCTGLEKVTDTLGLVLKLTSSARIR